MISPFKSSWDHFFVKKVTCAETVSSIEEEIETREKVLETTTKNVLRLWRSVSKVSLRSNWSGSAKGTATGASINRKIALKITT